MTPDITALRRVLDTTPRFKLISIEHSTLDAILTELAALREALEPFARSLSDPLTPKTFLHLTAHDVRRARAALATKGE